MPIEILSDGLDYAIHFILRHYDFDYLPVTANRLEEVGAREWRLGFPNASPMCRAKSGTCKCTRTMPAPSTSGPPPAAS